MTPPPIDLPFLPFRPLLRPPCAACRGCAIKLLPTRADCATAAPADPGTGLCAARYRDTQGAAQLTPAARFAAARLRRRADRGFWPLERPEPSADSGSRATVAAARVPFSTAVPSGATPTWPFATGTPSTSRSKPYWYPRRR